jgi:hypothetical protein
MTHDFKNATHVGVGKLELLHDFPPRVEGLHLGKLAVRPPASRREMGWPLGPLRRRAWGGRRYHSTGLDPDCRLAPTATCKAEFRQLVHGVLMKSRSMVVPSQSQACLPLTLPTSSPGCSSVKPRMSVERTPMEHLGRVPAEPVHSLIVWFK